MEGSHVAQEGQEFGPSLLGLDVAVELVGGKVIGRKEVAHPVCADIGGPARPARGRARSTADVALGPMAPRMRLEVERPELVAADDDAGIARPCLDLSVGQVIELEDALLLQLEVGVAGFLPGLDGLKDTPLTEKRPESLVADVLNHPLSHQVVGQLGERPGREGLAVIGRTAESDLLDLGPLGGAELGRPAPGVFFWGPRNRSRRG